MKKFKNSDSLIVSGTLIVIALSRVLSIRDLYILGNFFQSFGQQLATIAAEQQLFLKNNKSTRDGILKEILNKEFITKKDYSVLINQIKELEGIIANINTDIPGGE